MPRYFFHFRSGDQLSEDYEGELLPDLAAVEENAMASAREILAEELLGRQPALAGCSFEVCDETKNVVFIYPFSKAA
jgi:hypothetical protein